MEDNITFTIQDLIDLLEKQDKSKEIRIYSYSGYTVIPDVVSASIDDDGNPIMILEYKEL